MTHGKASLTQTAWAFHIRTFKSGPPDSRSCPYHLTVCPRSFSDLKLQEPKFLNPVLTSQSLEVYSPLTRSPKLNCTDTPTTPDVLGQ